MRYANRLKVEEKCKLLNIFFKFCLFEDIFEIEFNFWLMGSISNKIEVKYVKANGQSFIAGKSLMQNVQ